MGAAAEVGEATFMVEGDRFCLFERVGKDFYLVRVLPDRPEVLYGLYAGHFFPDYRDVASGDKEHTLFYGSEVLFGETVF